MTTTTPAPTEAMKQALERIKYEAESLADAQVIALEALAASQPEPVFTLNGGTLSEQMTSQPEPKAGEPEVVATMNCAGDGGGYVHVKPTLAAEKLPRGKYQLITLSAHREAMATFERHKKDWAESAHIFKQQRNEAREALAKKDAALVACVEEMEGAQLCLSQGDSWRATRYLNVAIAKAKEARGV